MLILLCFSSSSKVNAEDIKDHKNVLIINSYHQGFAWSKNETDGIIDTLNESSNYISTFIEYMDWKNYPSGENLQQLQVYYKYKYQNKDIDVLIATDDVALEFVLENRKNLFSNAPVVFCGVNQNGVTQITSGYDNFTGVIEEVDPTETVKMALSINPTLNNVYILYDNSESGTSTGKIVIDKIKSMNMNLNTIPLNNLSYDELIKNVRNYDKDSIILATTYYSDVNGKVVEFENISRLIGINSSVPVYHLFDVGLNNGAFGGVMMSGKLQGVNAANLAIRILAGVNPDDIPVISPETTRKVFDFQKLKRFNISLKQIPKDSEVINKPFSFYETYRALVTRVFAMFFVLLTFVFVLLFYIVKIKRMRKDLSDSHEELTQIYEELAASDEDLKLKFNEVLTVNEMLRISEEKLTHLAFHDTLTGLPNIVALYENPNNHTFFSKSNKSALLYVDIDNFKYINDAMGHVFGDQLLIKTSERLAEIVELYCSDYFIYRLSGDEFVIIIDDIKGKGDVEALASKILLGFKEEFDVQNSVIYVSLSIGISIYPEHSNNLEDLIKYADIAMYKSKDAGRSSFVVYDQLMNEAFTERVNIERYLYTALVRNEFDVYYQPQYDMKLNKITGFEALMRWKSPELGSVPPLKFIKIAEDTHLIIQLGAWVLKIACVYLKKLHEKGYTDLTMSVNISILQLLQNDFYDMVIDTLKYVELEPKYLELEITESMLIESYGTIVSKLEILREAGVGIALDDFGKGYSSLSYLNLLPISTLKIDKSFIDDIICENISEPLAGQIIRLGKSMNMCVIAEGVERQEQMEYLLNHECNKIQGYIYSCPLPEADIEKLLLRMGEQTC